MKEHYDFTGSIKNPFVSDVNPDLSKIEVTFLIDTDIVRFLKNHVGKDYKDYVNRLLRTYMEHNK